LESDDLEAVTLHGVAVILGLNG